MIYVILKQQSYFFFTLMAFFNYSIMITGNEKIIIRSIEKRDAEKYFNLINENRDRISKYFPKTVSSNKDLSSTIQFTDLRISLSEKNEFFTYLIEERVTEKIIGSVFLKDIDWHIGKGEMGFFIDRNYEGKGIITKAVGLVTDHLFANKNLNKIFLRISRDNYGSLRVAEKNRFTREGVLRSDFKTFDGELIDVMYFGLLKDEVSK